jgi:glycerol uptake facilitator-like aquaporin
MNEATDDGTDTPSTGDLSQVSAEEYYRLTYHAVRDALLDVIGTVLLTVVAFALVWIGGAAAMSPAAGLAEIGVGLAIAALGLYLAATTLDVIPPVQEWL